MERRMAGDKGGDKGGERKTAAKPRRRELARKAANGASGAKKPARGRTRGLTETSAFLGGAIGDAAAKRGIAETRLLTRWAEIVGSDIAAATQPLSLKPRSGLALGGALSLAVDGARSTEIEHKIPQIIERVNAYYGYRAVALVSLNQAASATRARPSAAESARIEPPQVTPPQVTEAERSRVAAMTGGVENSALRAALARLGENVIARAAEKRASKAKSFARAPREDEKSAAPRSGKSTDTDGGA